VPVPAGFPTVDVWWFARRCEHLRNQSHWKRPGASPWLIRNSGNSLASKCCVGVAGSARSSTKPKLQNRLLSTVLALSRMSGLHTSWPRKRTSRKPPTSKHRGWGVCFGLGRPMEAPGRPARARSRRSAPQRGRSAIHPTTIRSGRTNYFAPISGHSLRSGFLTPETIRGLPPQAPRHLARLRPSD
jgi:hypothetical protein